MTFDASMNLGMAERNKIGVDVSYSNWGFTVSGELMMTQYNFNSSQEANIKANNDLLNANENSFQNLKNEYTNLQGVIDQVPDETTKAVLQGNYDALADGYDAVPSALFGYVSDSFDKMFYFVTVQYDLPLDNTDIYVYGMTSNIQADNIYYMTDGLTNFSGGMGWSPTFGVVLKAQYSTFELNSPGGNYLDSNMMLAVSVMF